MTSNEIRFGLMSEKGIMDDVFIWEGCKKSIIIKKESCICVLWTKGRLLTEYQGKCWSGQ